MLILSKKKEHVLFAAHVDDVRSCILGSLKRGGVYSEGGVGGIHRLAKVSAQELLSRSPFNICIAMLKFSFSYFKDCL